MNYKEEYDRERHEHIVRVHKVVADVKPLLTDQSPEVIGSVLADLVALFVAAHEPQVRDKVLDIHITLVRKLVPIVDAIAELEKKSRGQQPNQNRNG